MAALSAAVVLDGKAVAARVRAEVKVRVQAFERERGRPPGLAVVLVGANPAETMPPIMQYFEAQQAQGLRGNRHPLDGLRSAE